LNPRRGLGLGDSAEKREQDNGKDDQRCHIDNIGSVHAGYSSFRNSVIAADMAEVISGDTAAVPVVRGGVFGGSRMSLSQPIR
jgi:hypothetical protein